MKQTGFMTYAAGALAALGLMALAAPGAWAQGNTDNATATATAEVIAGITLAKAADLDFGDFTVGATGGTITIPANASPTPAKSGDVEVVANSPTAAKFTVGGQAGKGYDITLPSSTTTLTLAGDTETMTIAADTWSDSKGGANGTGGTNGTCCGDFFVGATLTVGNLTANPAGVYTSSAFTITVTYQ